MGLLCLCVSCDFAPKLPCVPSVEFLFWNGCQTLRSISSLFMMFSVTAKMSEIRRSSKSIDMVSRTTTRRISVPSSLGGRG